MGKTTAPPFEDMVDQAVHACTAEKDKAGRKPLYAYIEEHWKVDMGDDDSKASFKTAMEKRIEEGIIVQDKQSFHFSPKGRKYYNENYES